MKNFLTFILIIILVPVFTFTIHPKEIEKNIVTTTIEDKEVIPMKKKYIAITFDDGPSKYTSTILNILNKYQVHATFFMLGTNINDSNKEIIKQLVEQGSEIGSHTYTHKILTKISTTKLDKEINYTRTLLSDITNTNIVLTRPPYGSINNYIKTNYKSPYILWSIDTKDWRIRDTNKIYNYVIDKATDGDIVLLHETYQTTVEALNLIIPKLLEDNFELVTVSNLAKIKGITIENNKIYHSFK